MRRREFVGLIGAAAAWAHGSGGAQQPSAKLPIVGFIGPSTAERRSHPSRGVAGTGLANSAGSRTATSKSNSFGPMALWPGAGEIAAKYAQQSVVPDRGQRRRPGQSRQERDFHDPDRDCGGRRSVGNGPGRQPVAARRQRHRHVAAIDQLHRQAAGAVAARSSRAGGLAILFNAGNPLTRPELETAGEGRTGRWASRRVTRGNPQQRRCPAGDRGVGRQGRCALCLHRPPCQHQQRADQRPGAGGAAADDALFARQHQFRRHDLLRAPTPSICSGSAAEFVDKILRGAKPADLPVEAADQVRTGDQPEYGKDDRHRDPPTLLARADEVIE